MSSELEQPAVARGRRGKYSAGGYLRPFFAYTLSMSRYDRPSHQVSMYFFKRGGWQVQFLEADLKTPLPRSAHCTSTRPGCCGNNAGISSPWPAIPKPEPGRDRREPAWPPKRAAR
jgi:hypothetical protein